MITSNEGKNIWLRQTRPEDAEILLQAYDDEAFVRLYRSNQDQQTAEGLQEALQKRQELSPLQLRYLELMIVHKQYGAVGVAALGDYMPLHSRAEFLIGIFAEQHRRQGYGLEATLLMLDLAFNVYKLHKVYSYVYGYNEFSHKNMLHFGFKNEGYLEDHHYSKKEQAFVDLYINAIIETHFRESIKIARWSQRLIGRDITLPYQVVDTRELLQMEMVNADKKQAVIQAMQDSITRKQQSTR